MMGLALKLTAQKTRPLRRGLDHYWRVMMDFAVEGKSFTVQDVAGRSDGNTSPIHPFVRRLVAAGFIGVETFDKSPSVYNVIQKQSATPKMNADGTLVAGVVRQAAMWNTMRSPACRAGFTVQDLVVWGSTDESPIAIATARRYVSLLAKAGYLVQVGHALESKMALWRLLPHMNTGPAYPMALMTKVIFDQNRCEVMGETSFEEVNP